MRKLLTILLTALSLTAFSQGVVVRTQPNALSPSAPNYNKGIVQDANLQVAFTFSIPVSTTFTFNNANPRIGALAFATSTNRFGVYNGTTWDPYAKLSDIPSAVLWGYGLINDSGTIKVDTTLIRSVSNSLSLSEAQTKLNTRARLSGGNIFSGTQRVEGSPIIVAFGSTNQTQSFLNWQGLSVESRSFPFSGSFYGNSYLRFYQDFEQPNQFTTTLSYETLSANRNLLLPNEDGTLATKEGLTGVYQPLGQKDINGGYVGRNNTGGATLPGIMTIGGLQANGTANFMSNAYFDLGISLGTGQSISFGDGWRANSQSSTSFTLNNGLGAGNTSYNFSNNDIYDFNGIRFLKESDKGQPNGVASLDENGKVPISQINDALVGSVNYQGNYNASTNTPTLPTATGNKGKYYVISVAGTQQGLSLNVGDWIISNGSIWQKVDNNNSVTSVFGRTGAVTAQSGDYSAFYIQNQSLTPQTANFNISGTGRLASLEIGSASSSTSNVYSSANITGGTTANGFFMQSEIQSGVTSTAYGFRTALGTATGATTSLLIGFGAGNGAMNGTATTQVGFYVNPNFIGGSNNNYGFRGLIPAGTNRYNVYMDGTAMNYFMGNTGFGGGAGTPTAKINIGAGSASAGTAPLKFTSGTLLTTPENGAVEFLNDKTYITISTGTGRKEYTLNDVALNSGIVPITTTNGRLTNSSVTSTELGYVSGVTSSLQNQIDSKAPLASPALTDIPTAPTAATGTNTTQIATTAHVFSSVSNRFHLSSNNVATGNQTFQSSNGLNVIRVVNQASGIEELKLQNNGIVFGKFSGTQYDHILQTFTATPTAARTWTLPNATGTLAIKEDIKYGSTLVNFNGSQTVFNIPHGLGVNPSSMSITFGDASNANFVESVRTKDSTNITITCMSPPIAGSMTVYWVVYK